jgi:hypothetical protein
MREIDLAPATVIQRRQLQSGIVTELESPVCVKRLPPAKSEYRYRIRFCRSWGGG